ncbi:MAG: hypothetical protein HOW73_29425 [Polyangiaceae bacterium]|nr:hypothetical protein [Polyangiaceae bacterium]
MPLFEFELARIEDIEPWGNRSLSWFELTDGRFRMPVGDQVLFEYSEVITRHWEARLCAHTHQSAVFERAADYQIAAFVRDMLGSAAAGAARLPERVERLAADWERLTDLRNEADPNDESDEATDRADAAWRWLGERSPWTSYLVASPRFHFVRVGEEVRIHWDNREQRVDELPVWTAQAGVFAMPVERFLYECRDFAERLLLEMERRIAMVESGAALAQADMDPESLRWQQETWRTEFDSYFAGYQPEIPWDEAQRALELIAAKRGVPF